MIEFIIIVLMALSTGDSSVTNTSSDVPTDKSVPALDANPYA